MGNDFLFSVYLQVGGACGDLLDAVFEERDWNMTSWQDEDSGVVTFQEYFEKEDDAVARIAEVDGLASGICRGSSYELEVKRIEKRDWSEYWKRFFHVEKVSERIVIKLSWEDYEAGSSDIVIEIDPGMSFGTGQHPTTRMCLSMLDSMSVAGGGQTLIDLGCGSGILSIAAAKMGYRDVTGIDNDPLAVKIAIENAVLNGVRDKVGLSVADMEALKIEVKYDVVVINMLASLLTRFSEPAVKLLKAEESASRFILSGMLVSQYEDTIAVYEKLGLKVLETYERDQWQSAICCF